MRGSRRVEAVLEPELYDAWQEYLASERRTSQREIRWMIQVAVDEFYKMRAEQRQAEHAAAMAQMEVIRMPEEGSQDHLTAERLQQLLNGVES